MHLHHVVGLVYLGLLLLLSAAAVGYRGRFVLKCNAVIDRMYPHLLHGLNGFMDGTVELASLWECSQGYSGLWKRWWNSAYLVRLCQLQAKFDTKISEADLQYVTGRAAALSGVTFKTVLFASFRPQLMGEALALSVRLYIEMSDRTCTFYDSEGALLCAKRLASVL